MILGEPNLHAEESGDRTTLDDLFRRAGVRRPNAIALTDPPNRQSFTDGPPRRLTYGETDRIVSAIAGRLRRFGLPADTVVGLQLPNTVEAVLALLGVLRAGMIAAPIPLLWRRADAVPALGRIGAKVLLTGGRVGTVDHGGLAMSIAAEVFPIRYLGGFGAGMPDGIIPFDDLLTAPDVDHAPPFQRQDNPAAHLAIITWDVTADGLVPVARSHAELIAGGRLPVLEGRLPEDARILAPCPVSSFAGLALGVLPWLLTGGTLALHHPFDAAAFERQCREEACDTVVVPGPLLPRLAEAGLLGLDSLRTVLALWRAPERLAGSPPWQPPGLDLVDVLAFGEIALVGLRRDGNGQAQPFAAGPLLAPREGSGRVLLAELARTEAGRLAARGPMVPRHPFPPGVERTSLPQLKTDAAGYIDTGYACRLEHGMSALEVTGPPPGIVSVGGYRFLLRDLEGAARRAEDGASLAALPDALTGHRLAGSAPDRATARAALAALGVNPLLSDAFRDRRNGSPAA